MLRYFIIYKPYLVLSQFSSIDGHRSLSEFFTVPRDVYPVGRLDHDSEGLLILTNDTKLNKLLLKPDHKHEREYWVQVEGIIKPEAMEVLQKGITISAVGKMYKTRPCKASIFSSEPAVPVREPPIRYRKNIATSWLSITLTEGKNRQVRKMTAHVGFPTLRLIRYRIQDITVSKMQPGDMVELSKEKLYRLLHL